MLPDASDGRGVIGRCWVVEEGWVEAPRMREKMPIVLLLSAVSRGIVTGEEKEV